MHEWSTSKGARCQSMDLDKAGRPISGQSNTNSGMSKHDGGTEHGAVFLQIRGQGAGVQKDCCHVGKMSDALGGKNGRNRGRWGPRWAVTRGKQLARRAVKSARRSKAWTRHVPRRRRLREGSSVLVHRGERKKGEERE